MHSETEQLKQRIAELECENKYLLEEITKKTERVLQFEEATRGASHHNCFQQTEQLATSDSDGYGSAVQVGRLELR